MADNPDYEIKQELGRGGMGVVYLAHNTLRGRVEVLKVMRRQMIERPGIVDRVVRETRAVAKLRHPNIVSAHHATRCGESIIFTMEFVPGYDLSRLVKSKGPLPVAHACNFIYQAALGLQHAHEEGLVHRDIKPGNLMLSRKGDKPIIKMLDFGLAKATREEKIDGALTSEGQALGTPDFIAPEQILDAQSADIRADIYSVGGTLYYLLSGRPPFRATSLYDMYQAHISRDADPLNLIRPEVPSELAALVAKMMAKNSVRQFQTPGEVARALTPFFMRANSAFNRPQIGTTQLEDRPVARQVDTPTHPATLPEGTALRSMKAAEPIVADGRWESLINIKDPEDASVLTQAVRPARRPPWIWPTVGVAAVFLSILGAWFGGLFKVETKDGKIVVHGVPEDAEVEVDGQQKVYIRLKGDTWPVEITIPAGQHVVKVKKGELVTTGETVTLRAGEAKTITVHLEPLVVAPEAKQDEIDSPEPGNRPARKRLVESNGEITKGPIDRRLWIAGDGSRFENHEGKEWSEANPEGISFRWVEVGRNDQYVELFDGSRGGGGYIRLEDGRSQIRWTSRREAYRLFKVGDWGANAVDPKRSSEVVLGDPTRRTSAYVSLFNGKDLTGWKVDRGDPRIWRVEDGHLIADGADDFRQHTFLLTKDKYSDFVLRFEFWLTRDSDSGITIRAEPGETPPPLEINLSHFPDAPPGINAPTGALRWSDSVAQGDYLRPERSDLLRPSPVWNEMTITARGRSLTVTLNGHIVQDLDLDKFSARPIALASLKRQSGRVGFQSVTRTVRFRNIGIKDLGYTKMIASAKADRVATEGHLETAGPHLPGLASTAGPGRIDRTKKYPVYPWWKSIWQMSGDELVIKRTGSHSMIVLTKVIDLQDYTFEAEVKRIEGNGAIELHVGDKEYVIFGSNINHNHTMTFLRSFNREAHPSNRVPQPIDPFDKDGWVHLSVEKKGKSVVYRVDNEEVYHASDDEMTRGFLALATVGADARFRNIKATGSGGKVLLEGLPDLPRLEE